MTWWVDVTYQRLFSSRTYFKLSRFQYGLNVRFVYWIRNAILCMNIGFFNTPIYF